MRFIYVFDMALPHLRLNIFLIGDVDVKIEGNKLPSKLQVMKLLMFYLRVANLDVNSSISAVIDEVLLFWKKANIPTQELHRCHQKLLSLLTEWRNLDKHRDRSLPKQEIFKLSLNDLFDIAHGNVMTLIDNETKVFLENQRKEGRIGYIANIQTMYDLEEEFQSSSSQLSSISEEKQS